MLPKLIQSKHIACIYLLYSFTFNNQTHGDIALNEQSTDLANKDYNILIRELRLNFASGLRFIWDSNFNLESNNETASFAVSPELVVEAYWPISPNLEFSTGVTLGYDHYLEGEGDDGLTISGIENTASNFDFNINLGNDAIITVSNEFSANIASASTQTNAGRKDQSFRRFENVSSVQYAQLLTPQTLVSSGYSFSKTFTTTAAIDNSIDHDRHGIFTRISTQLNDSLTSSLLGDFYNYTYADNQRNDSRRYQLGPELTYTSKSGLTARVHVAFDYLDVDNTNNPTTQDNESTNLYFESSVSFTTAPFLNHTFSFNHRLALSEATTASPNNPGETIPVNFEENTSFEYALNYLVRDSLTIDISHNLARIKESDNSNEYFEQYIEVGPRFNLNEQTTIYATYAYINVFDSNSSEFNYDRHLVETGFRLNF